MHGGRGGHRSLAGGRGGSGSGAGHTKLDARAAAHAMDSPVSRRRQGRRAGAWAGGKGAGDAPPAGAAPCAGGQLARAARAVCGHAATAGRCSGRPVGQPPQAASHPRIGRRGPGLFSAGVCAARAAVRRGGLSSRAGAVCCRRGAAKGSTLGTPCANTRMPPAPCRQPRITLAARGAPWPCFCRTLPRPCAHTGRARAPCPPRR